MSAEQRRRRLAALLDAAVPRSTRDDQPEDGREDRPEAGTEADPDQQLRDDVPPHHG